ncbi:MAG: hypothetical protein DRG78_20195 [Epsilonproteobacteria bacterium]|nr:MAG: hypothetical protein DRG78_20195 [Campylobacterota bacterium]
MKVDEFQADYFRENETIDVQCLWLQKQLKEKDKALRAFEMARKEIELLKTIIEAKTDKEKSKYFLDEVA